MGIFATPVSRNNSNIHVNAGVVAGIRFPGIPTTRNNSPISDILVNASGGGPHRISNWTQCAVVGLQSSQQASHSLAPWHILLHETLSKQHPGRRMRRRPTIDIDQRWYPGAYTIVQTHVLIVRNTGTTIDVAIAKVQQHVD